MDNICLCFLCNLNEVDENFPSKDSQELSIILCQILDIPHVEKYIQKFENISYCQPCKDIILNICDLLKKLKELEKNVLEKKYLVKLLLEENTSQNNFRNKIKNYNEQSRFQSELINEMRFNSIKSMLTISQNQYNRKVCSNAKRFRIMKNVTVFKRTEHEVLEEHSLEHRIPEDLITPLIFNLVCTDKTPVQNMISGVQESGPMDFKEEQDIFINSSFNESELSLTSYLYDYNDINLRTFKAEPNNLTEVRDPFEGIIPELNFDEQDSNIQKTFICETCSMTFDDWNHLGEHCRTHDIAKEPISNNELTTTYSAKKNFKCKYCSEIFPDSNEFKLHEQIHFECKYCNKTFSNRKKVRMHEQIHRKEKQFKCRLCGKAFNVMSYLKSHERRHEVEKFYKCRYCDNQFCKPSEKKSHEQTHTSEKPYKCKYCKNTISRQEQHICEPVKKFVKCQYCELSFITMNTLKIHQLRHTGKKSFKCEYCHKFFYTMHEKRVHERIHTGEKPYKCKFCEKVYPSRSSANNHERTAHTHTELEVRIPV